MKTLLIITIPFLVVMMLCVGGLIACSVAQESYQNNSSYNHDFGGGCTDKVTTSHCVDGSCTTMSECADKIGSTPYDKTADILIAVFVGAGLMAVMVSFSYGLWSLR